MKLEGKAAFAPETLALVCFELLLLLAGMWVETHKVFTGLQRILDSSGVLITDYMDVGGVGAALVNAAITGLIGVAILCFLGIRPAGIHVAAIMTMTGFALFGKNPLNVTPIILGGLLNATASRKPLKDVVVTTLFATSLAPAITHIVHDVGLGWHVGILVGVMVGFIIPSIASSLYHCHNGTNLYNVGFAAGILGAVVYAIIVRWFGKHNHVPRWSTEWSTHLGISVTLLFAAVTLLGAVMIGRQNLKKYIMILKSSGKAPCDFVQVAGWPATLLNIGLVGTVGCIYVFLTGGPFNGPTIGGLFTMAGFAAFGKHPRNIIPIMFGVFLGCKLFGISPNEPGPILAALFGTALAPIAGLFGPVAGILAGILHVAVVLNVGGVHGGLNLYNNGFAAGLVATIFWGVWPLLAEVACTAYRGLTMLVGGDVLE